MRLEREVAIVTGGARGIGRAVAERFGNDSASVGVLDTDPDGAVATAKALAARRCARSGSPRTLRIRSRSSEPWSVWPES